MDGPSVPESTREEDAAAVAAEVFQPFGLAPDEMDLVKVLLPLSGGAEYAKILKEAARSFPGKWEEADAAYRSLRIHQTMAFHTPAADYERIALRTGACLLLEGEKDLGDSILLKASTIEWDPGAPQGGDWMVLFQGAMYAFMFAIIAVSSFTSGYLLFLIPGVVVVAVALLGGWAYERGKRKLKRSQGLAKRYLAALATVKGDRTLRDVFAANGSLAADGA